MNDITKKDKSLEESGLLVNGASETIKEKAKEQKGRFLFYVIRYISCQCNSSY